jgi:TonB-dependent siderophore receptor
MTMKSGEIRRARGASKAVLLAATALVTAAMGPAALAQTTTVQAAPQTFSFAIPAGRLSVALAAWAEVTGYQYAWSDPDAQSLASPGVSGRMSAEAALAALTAGAGTAYSISADRTATITRSAAPGERLLGPVRVEGATYGGAPGRGEGVAQLGGVRGRQDDEARGYRPVVSAVGMGAPTAIEDIPRSVSVLTQDQIEKQNITDFGEALRRMPGITLIEGFNTVFGATVVSRGFNMDRFQIDGGAPRNLALSMLGNGLLDLGGYERVELLRGPNGLFVGDGSPGGTLNLVRKRPGDQQQTRVTLRAGSWNRAEAEIDYSTPQLLGTTLSFRGVAAFKRQEFAWDRTDRASTLLYGLFDAPMGDAARIEAGYQFTNVEESATYQGVPRYVDGPLVRLPRSFNFVPEWAYNNARTHEWFSRFYVDLLSDWNFDFGATYSILNQDGVEFQANPNLYSVTDAPFPGLNPSAPFTRERGSHNTGQFSLDFHLTGAAKTWFLDHAVSVSGDFYEFTGHNTIRERRITNLGTFLIRSKTDLDPSRLPAPIFEPFSSNENFNYSSSRIGLVLADTISWRNKVDLNLAVRRYDSESSGIQVQNDPLTGLVTRVDPPESFSGDSKPKDGWRPSWSLVLKPIKGLSLYGSHSEGSTDQSGNYTTGGRRLDPSVYENLELGVKYGREGWLASLAAYNLDRTNVAVSIPGTQGQCPPQATSLCYYEGGATEKSRGVDVELTGELTKAVSAVFSYNWNEQKQVSSQAPSYTQAPVHSAKLLLDWRPWFNDRLSIDLSAAYRDRVYQAGSRRFIVTETPLVTQTVPFALKEPPFVAFDLGVSYAVSDAMDLRLYVENLTDKEYSTTISQTRDYRAAPRSVLVSLTWRDTGARQVATALTAPFGEAADWYGGFAAGYHALGDLEATAAGRKADGSPIAWTFETEGGALLDVLLGYRISPHLRAEFEGGFRRSDFGRIAGEGSAPNGVCGVDRVRNGLPFTCDDAQGDADSWSFMVNGIYDFGPQDWRVRPFAGAGVGLSRSSIDFSGKMKGIGSDDIETYCTARRPAPDGRCSAATIPNSVYIGGDDQFITVAYQGLGGLSWRLTDRVTLDATYRYYVVPKIKWSSFNLPYRSAFDPPTAPLTPRVGAFKAKYEDHSATLALRWAFGAR